MNRELLERLQLLEFCDCLIAHSDKVGVRPKVQNLDRVERCDGRYFGNNNFVLFKRHASYTSQAFSERIFDQGCC